MKMKPGNTIWRKTACVLVAAGLMPLCFLWLAGCGDGGGAASADRLKVAATIQPLADFCRQVGGERVEVETLVPGGADPHTFEPTARQMKLLSEARLLVVNGLGLESWVTSVLDDLDRPGMARVVTTSSIPESDLLPVQEKGEDGVWDPHVWLDPELAAYQVAAIRDALAEADPDNAGEYRANAEAYLAQLDGLDQWASDVTGTFSKHPSWTYFARRYGLEMVGVVEESPGREPGAAKLTELLDAIKASGVTVIFTDPQFSPRAAQAIADSTGGQVEVRVLDPLGNPDDPQVDTYIKLMQHDVESMREVLQ
jgi:zinc transport system substrate-binding protein